MRVLFTVNTASVFGGVETWLDHVVNALGAAGEDVLVALAQGQKYNRPDRFLAAHDFPETLVVDGSGLNREGRVLALERAIRKVQPDIVIPLGMIDGFEAVARRKEAGQDCRLVVHAQGNLPPMLADLADYQPVVDRVVCPGRLTGLVLNRTLGFEPDQLTRIANGAGAARAERMPKESGGEPEAPIRIGYVGRLTRHDKRCLDLVGLCQGLSQLGTRFSLHVVGEGPCRDELQEGLAEFGEHVKVHGALDQDALYERIYPALDVLVLPSASEAFGIVLVEAMAHGVVPVVSRYAGFRAEALIEEGVDGLAFEVGDMEAAARAVDRLWRDDSERILLGERGRRKAASYDWKLSTRAWTETLREVSRQPVRCGPRRRLTASGRGGSTLDAWPIPESVKDVARRVRRHLFGAAVPEGGEEWPLFARTHDETRLAEIERALVECDVRADADAASDDRRLAPA